MIANILNKNIGKISRHIFVAVLFCLIFTYAVFAIIGIMPLRIIPYSSLYTLAGLVLYLCLENMIRNEHYDLLSPLQRYVNYGALALISIGLWLGLCYGFIILFYDPELTLKFQSLLPMQGLLSLLFYILVISWYQQEKEIEEALENEDMALGQSTELNQETNLSSIQAVELLERIAIKSGSKLDVIKVEDILYFQADGDYVQITTAKGHYLKEQTMRYFEQNLPRYFIRVHRSYIVNVGEISKIELYDKQNHLVILKNGENIKISQAGYKLLRTFLEL